MAKEDFSEVIAALREMEQDSALPRNVREKLEEIFKILDEDAEPKLKIDRIMSELDEISDNANLQAYTRTQIWNVVSLLEKV
ncbi:UPF0147 family protein [Candidatus Woesearchaeota archaeon]|nr:UPF0147 family protein [Candidatus Woesearchaeota archaeon]